MGKTTKIPEVMRVVADVLWESGGGVRKPAAKVHRDAEGRDVRRWIDPTRLMAAIADCAPHDAMLAMSGVLWDMRAGTPLPPMFNFKEDADDWVAAATSDELIAYANAAIAALADLPVGKRSRIGLAAVFMSGLSVEDCREAFQHSRRKAASARTAPDPASGDPQVAACRVTLGARASEET